jgi:hypothetical protein
VNSKFSEKVSPAAHFSDRFSWQTRLASLRSEIDPNNAALMFSNEVSIIGLTLAPFFGVQSAGRRGSHRGGHLYIQANEISNAITYYRRSHDGTIAEDERMSAGGAGSGYSSPSADRVQPRVLARGGEAGEGSGGIAVARAARNFDLHGAQMDPRGER